MTNRNLGHAVTSRVGRSSNKRPKDNLSFSSIPSITEDEIFLFKRIEVGSFKTFVLLAQFARGRKKISELSGISEDRILSLYHEASLLRINGLGPYYLTFLRKNKYTLRSLAKNTAPSVLHHEFICEEEIEIKPSLKKIQGWVDQAKKLSMFYVDYV